MLPVLAVFLFQYYYPRTMSELGRLNNLRNRGESLPND